jgi:uncharacterized membrane protein (DUF373 family)|tara:strand:- start:97 stop:279 length:183 start_codon:yes stop_codon:yes gene_type:complete
MAVLKTVKISSMLRKIFLPVSGKKHPVKNAFMLTTILGCLYTIYVLENFSASLMILWFTT